MSTSAGDGSQRTAPVLPNVIFFTDNGHGLGHLTRLMAVARKAGGEFNPVFLTMSLGFPLLEEFGFRFEYFPSYMILDMSRARWDPLLLSRLTELVEATKARSVVVDHISPPRSFGWLRDRLDTVDFIWCRRGLWKEDRNREGVIRAREFDLVVEPADIAAPLDSGFTSEYRRGVRSVPPIVLVEPQDLLPRHEAREALDVPTNATAVLIQLTDSDPETLEHMIAHTRSVIAERVNGELSCFAPLHPLHGGGLSDIAGVAMKPIYPVARYLKAFDGVVSTAGYNSFHEVIISGVPAVFVPRATNSVDDQERRARFAELCGRAYWAPSVEAEEFRDAIHCMLEPDEPDIAAETARGLGPMNGAGALARIVSDRISGRRDQQGLRLKSVTQPPGRNWQYSHLKGDADVVLVEAFATTEASLRSALESLGAHEGQGNELPVVMADDTHADLLISLGVPFETVMREADWSTVDSGLAYRAYIDQRTSRAYQRYGASRTLRLV